MPSIERQGNVSVPYTRMKPRVICGVCESCGVINNLLPSIEQYKLCPHFKELGELRCTYCPEHADPLDVLSKADMKVHEHPDKPGVYVVVCDRYECAKAHQERFKRNV